MRHSDVFQFGEMASCEVRLYCGTVLRTMIEHYSMSANGIVSFQNVLVDIISLKPINNRSIRKMKY